MLNSNFAHKQRGATLIVTLIILVTMTILGLSAIRNSSVQQAIIKNTQFLISARNTAKTELNGQVDVINNNPITEDDILIGEILILGVGVEKIIAETKSSYDDDNAAVTPENLSAEQSTFAQKVSVELVNEHSGTLAGFDLGTEAAVKGIQGIFVSQATFNNTSANSSQIQGFDYIAPN
jgi:Tfp pilus assembly protein PilX